MSGTRMNMYSYVYTKHVIYGVTLYIQLLYINIFIYVNKLN